MYKCSKCGHKSRTFAAMAKHARKHGFKRKQKAMVPRQRRVKVNDAPTSMAFAFCPHCGGRL
jgi:hypothetical protein